ncbi:hypothetical protein BDN72DRAFT_877633 [Pluteus cervinus]|uniref:Uncharacterized protein n=1 Tax=Pluteus cervinus TaxID=181527 RepID=A0ACD3AZC4_9AGAR|nr:hypothetical protein BDN72DRAFT_877633 [Pluteus cervinus]
MVVDFPLEIVSTFLGYLNDDTLARDDHLLRCCLVSRSWCSIAQPLLFSAVRMRAPKRNSEEMIQIFRKTLEESPHTRKYIQTLSIEIQDATPITPLLRLVNDLRCLRFSFSPFMRIPSLPPDLLLSVPNLFQSERFTSLSLKRVRNVPVGLFAHCVALQELALSRVTFTGLAEFPPETDAPRPQLRALVLFNIFWDEMAILSWLTDPRCSFNLSNLTTFIAMDRSGSLQVYQKICEFVSFVSGSLENMLLDLPTDGTSQLSGMLQVDRLRNLRSISIWLLQDVEDSVNLLPPILDILKRLPNPGLLEKVELPSSFHSSGVLNEVLLSVDTMHSQGWSEFDSILGSSAFHSLRSVEITAYTVPDVPTGLQYIGLFTSALPALFESGKLRIETTTVDLYVSRQEEVWFA